MEGPDLFPFLLIFREEVDCLGLVLDFAFFAVLLVCIIVAAKRGFVLSLMELVGFFLAGACALSLSGLIAPEILRSFLCTAGYPGNCRSASGFVGRGNSRPAGACRS